MPADKIKSTAQILFQSSPKTPGILVLDHYFQNFWLAERLCKVSSWCQFRKLIRSNNDLEGYHTRLKSKAQKRKLNFYKLIQLLHEESTFVAKVEQFVTEHKVIRSNIIRSMEKNRRLNDLWTLFDYQKLTPLELVEQCAKFIYPLKKTAAS